MCIKILEIYSLHKKKKGDCGHASEMHTPSTMDSLYTFVNVSVLLTTQQHLE
jgi:hypothetical protein